MEIPFPATLNMEVCPLPGKGATLNIEMCLLPGRDATVKMKVCPLPLVAPESCIPQGCWAGTGLTSFTVGLVRPIPTVILAITLLRLWDTLAVVTL